MVGMIVLSFLIGYPLFILIAFVLAKVLFPDLEKQATLQKQERAVLLEKARRRKAARTPVLTARPRPSFRLSMDSGKMLSNEVG